MHLSELELNNFRSFSEETVHFEKKLTVLVGENNGGKSNIIDAIRLLTTPLGGRRELYCEHTDIRFGSSPASFELKANFQDLTPPQQGRMLSATMDDSLQSACFGITYNAAVRTQYARPTLWGGRFKAAPEPGSHEMIRHVYLPPLRDAKLALASGNPTRIHALLNHFLGDQEAAEVAQSLARSADNPILGNVDSAVASGLNDLTAGVRRQSAKLGFNTNESLIDIARDLRFKLADHGISPEDLKYSGHGYANLLYMAIIAVELEKTDNAELTLFLVEEPEAHLHPQLQAAVLNFLEERAEQSFKPKSDPNAPAGNLQVVVATHSPNLSAWVPNRNLVFVKSIIPETMTAETAETPAEDEEQSLADLGDSAEPRGISEAQAEPSPAQPLRPESRCIPLSKLELSDEERRKIDRYLDVTKSALLFGGRVFLVEGIAEALLLPAIAKHHVLKDRPADFRIFRSAVFVPIDGVDFEPYAKALLSPYNGVRIAERLVIVTDGDAKASDDEGDELPGQNRKNKLEELARIKAASGNLDVCINTYSLETELLNAGNAAIMKEVYLELHSRSEAKWDRAAALEGSEKAKEIHEIFKGTRKGDFAQILSGKVANSADFQVPQYLIDAIEAIVK
ncbi:ATP-dependent nuclease [Vannielia litorea]|uniref:Putative ATP-dependent endonuclease of the OLD family n=1 Tax=Vannielia litorea TaxID=1217970 RepID=A0A1N6E4A1_9RHOB|nr:AAA family ATPase [Vannielia litorea]SIN77803.1 putative ATP-dependent endonuclease of the OLD family [Vannielia litorea]